MDVLAARGHVAFSVGRRTFAPQEQAQKAACSRMSRLSLKVAL